MHYTQRLQHRKEIEQRDELIGRLADYLVNECKVPLEEVLGGWEFDHASDRLGAYEEEQAEEDRRRNHDPDYERDRIHALQEDAWEARRDAAREEAI